MAPAAEHWNPLTPAFDVTRSEIIFHQNRIVVIHFWAKWNPIDREMDAVIQDLRPLYQNKIAIYSLDVDPETNWKLPRECRIINVPALGCFVNGKLLETNTGFVSKEQLMRLFDRWITAAGAGD